ncbi:MAG: putative XRE-type DNA-binding protein [Candidatus Latescibacterota bacterium]|jgi:predicted XRE-type DNA-binding protein
MEITPSSGNVFLDLGFSPEEAENMKIRSSLIISIRKVIETRGLKQSEAAELFGVTQPRISDLVRGKVALFSIDALVNMLGHAGLHVELSVQPKEHQVA